MTTFFGVIWKSDRRNEIVSKKTLNHYLNSPRFFSEIKEHAEFDDITSCCKFLGLRPRQTVYVDGACNNHGNSSGHYGGIGVYYGKGDRRNISRPIAEKGITSQVAELHALYVALSRALNEFKHDKYSRPLVLMTDSLSSVEFVTKRYIQWEKNGWKTKKRSPVPDAELIRKIVRLIKDLNSTYARRGYNAKVQIIHVRGHSGIKGNVEADKLAKKGARMFKVKEA
ncbi:hypothetical protein TRVA0_057S00892 [Trichomonascus vanleenenianus]|uniref:ribonuclease H family protein n=1 Tax=Trichomonascus vanleenenianus TaxID=2268995 RepID=UPI003EC9753F